MPRQKRTKRTRKFVAYEFVVTHPLTIAYHIRKRHAKDTVCGWLARVRDRAGFKVSLRVAPSDIYRMCVPCLTCGRKVFKLRGLGA